MKSSSLNQSILKAARAQKTQEGSLSYAMTFESEDMDHLEDAITLQGLDANLKLHTFGKKASRPPHPF